MAKSSNQKLKLLYLMKILMENTDDNHGMTMTEIISSLDAYGVSAERKSIYSDMESLRVFGVDIIGEQSDNVYRYHIGNRQFELAELKLLVDSVQSAKFITAKKSNDLIKKIEGFASKYQASQLQRQVFIAERVKTMNTTMYDNVDEIHNAIGSNFKITFQYFRWDENKKRVLKRDGARYEVSPWALTCDHDNYYMVAFDSEENKIKHFRVDKMLHIEITNKKREGVECFKELNMAVYSKKMFGMFTGDEQYVKLLCKNSMAGVMIDRFGKDIILIKKDNEHFTVNVKVVVSVQFLGWVMSLGDSVRIISPENVVEQMKSAVSTLHNMYS